LEAVLDRGHCQGAVRGILEVGAQNKIALRLYYNFGFQVVGRRIGYYPGTGEDALLLEADLRIRQFGWEANPCLQPASIQGLETRLNR
jgi:ribosomal protein S18 acetylase RimI-like enzyme